MIKMDQSNYNIIKQQGKNQAGVNDRESMVVFVDGFIMKSVGMTTWVWPMLTIFGLLACLSIIGLFAGIPMLIIGGIMWAKAPKKKRKFRQDIMDFIDADPEFN